MERIYPRTLLAASWAALVLAMLAMAVGHTGAPDLNWLANQISTYAATAPNRAWITAGMVLPCVAIACLSVLVSRHGLLGESPPAHAVPLLAGGVISGLLTLAVFRETARSYVMLKGAGLDAIRQQSFHDAGLMIFFYSAILLAVLSGMLVMAQARAWAGKVLGASVSLLGLAAFPLMAAPWPQLLGITGAVHGLMQRASLFSLWLATALVLAAATSNLLRPSQGASDPGH